MLTYPKKGSPEAKAWAEKMKKARLKAKIRRAGRKTEQAFFGPGSPLEVHKQNPEGIYYIMHDPANPRHAWIVSYKKVNAYEKEGFKTLSGPFYSQQEAESYASRGGRKRAGTNPGAKWHEAVAAVAGRYRKDAPTATEKHIYAGMEIAHKDSASAARKLHMNPKKRMKKNPIAIYNPPSVAGVIYKNAIEIRAEKMGGNLKGFYKHTFGPNVQILGLTNGDVLLHHKGGKRLWISREDYERSGRRHE